MESKVIQVQIIFVLNCEGVVCVGSGEREIVQKVPSSKSSLKSKIMGQSTNMCVNRELKYTEVRGV